MSEPELSKDTSTDPLSESRKRDIVENLLPGIGVDGAEKLLSYTQERPVEAGRILVAQGDKDTDLFLLLRGSFSVFEKIRINQRDVVLQTATFPAPVILGEVNLLMESARSATVVAIEEADVLVLTHASFLSLSEEHPKLAIEIVKCLGVAIHNRSVAFQHKVRGNILREGKTVEGGIAKLVRYIGKVSQCPESVTNKLFSPDLKGYNYDA